MPLLVKTTLQLLGYSVMELLLIQSKAENNAMIGAN